MSSNVVEDCGPILLGGLLAFGLSGCVNMQFFVYWRLYSYESLRAKSLVIATWLLDLCHSAFVAIALWDSIIMPYSNMNESDNIPWYAWSHYSLSAGNLIFFAYRIYRLQKKRLAVAVPIVSSCSSVFYLMIDGQLCITKYIDWIFLQWIFTVGLSLSVFVDIMIAAFMCYFLRKNRTVVTSTIRIVDTLTLWTIRNGSMTSAAAIASLICWLVMPGNLIFLGLHFVVAKLYANSLLATLNARQHIRNGKQYDPSSDHPLPIVFSEDWENTTETLRSQHGFPVMQLNSYIPRAQNEKRGKTIQVNVERVVESKPENVALAQPTESCTEGSTV
ncbi:uncharacterized protein F5147DRAFT_785757 [Suillus discolor]|uniref:DUF6534 domain-containing protein n=1 Tax=Suillus discolor TaxID=1912936 RepID=A0A9P7FJR8_9AGAM|nr:uncharacterized protein F5147DRAFT_785757 [Suillus discolor]KAG2120689.1 hypothetical protein F5147DRAFT_785757 [Suillus discolor]